MAVFGKSGMSDVRTSSSLAVHRHVSMSASGCGDPSNVLFCILHAHLRS